MMLYHGSYMEIAAIDLARSKVGKDFGCGFYLSADRQQALRMAQRSVELREEGVPTVNAYEFDERLLRSQLLRVLQFTGYSEAWADFVLANRQNRTRKPMHGYDIVVGPIANDAVGYQIRRLTSGLIDKGQFLEELKYMKGVTLQYYFATEQAIAHLIKRDTP